MYAFYYSNLATFSFKHSDSMKWLCFWGFSSVESGAWWPPPSPMIGSLSPTSPTLSGAETTLKKPPSDQCHFLALMHVTYCHTVTKCNWPEKLQNFDVVARPFQQRSTLPSSSLVLPGAPWCRHNSPHSADHQSSALLDTTHIANNFQIATLAFLVFQK